MLSVLSPHRILRYLFPLDCNNWWEEMMFRAMVVWSGNDFCNFSSNVLFDREGSSGDRWSQLKMGIYVNEVSLGRASRVWAMELMTRSHNRSPRAWNDSMVDSVPNAVSIKPTHLCRQVTDQWMVRMETRAERNSSPGNAGVERYVHNVSNCIGATGAVYRDAGHRAQAAWKAPSIQGLYAANGKPAAGLDECA